MEKFTYSVLDVFSDNTVYFNEPTKWGKKIDLAIATQEQLKFLYEMKHPFVYIESENKNGSKG